MSRAAHSIITFYSYKGGTGRTATLANVAWLLASAGQRVCALDWDLEAPGLHRYFRPFLEDPDLELTDGLLDWLWEISALPLTTPSKSERRPSVLDYVVHLDWDFGRGSLDFLPAGRQDSDYAKRVTSFEWNNFYQRLAGAQAIDEARSLLRADYDFVLIDSRTGVSDTSGICTVQMPDRLVACYTLSRQSIEGVDGVLASVRKQRDNGRPLQILPLEMRVDTSEKQKLDAARAVARPRFSRYLSPGADPSYWENMEVLYWPFYNFEECLAVFGDALANRSRLSMLSAMERVARCVSGIPDVKALPVDSGSRRSVLARYALGSTESETDQALADGPEIFSEAFLRYQQWTKSEARTALLTGSVLRRLDAAGPLPPSLRADSQFMNYLIRSRDRQVSARKRMYTSAAVSFGVIAVASIVLSFLLPGKLALLYLAIAIAYGIGAIAAAWYVLVRLPKRPHPED
jgi:MinD-like ATPase involved in chromosome partitioning or flagellar assembly